MTYKSIALKDEDSQKLLTEARIKFLKEHTGVRATDEKVVLEALKKYVGDLL